jgi:hypothetical protein
MLERTVERAETGPLTWRRLLFRAAVLPGLCGFPLLGLPLLNDDRFDIYEYGAKYASRPTGIFVEQIQLIAFHLQVHGNFRPVGRMLERTQDTVVFLVSEAGGLPANLVLRAWFTLTLALLGTVLVLYVTTLTVPHRIFDRPPPGPAVLLPLALAPLLIASGSAGPVVLFTDIYFQTAVLVLLVAMWAGRLEHFERRKVRLVELVVAAFVGLVMAAFSELAAVAAPVTAFTVVVRGRVALRLSWSQLRSVVGTKLLMAGLAGFLALFLPVRGYLALHCATYDCYALSEMVFTTRTPAVMLGRSVSWLPPLAWGVATEPAAGWWFLPGHPAAMLLVLSVVLVSVQLLRGYRTAENPPGAARALLLLGGLMLLAGAAIGGTSSHMQARWWSIGTGWRDTTLLVIGGALVLAGATLAALERLQATRQKSAHAITGGLLILATAVTVQANGVWAEAVRREPESVLLNQIALSVVDLDDSETGQEHRCELLARYLRPYAPGSYEELRMEQALHQATSRMHDASYCERPRG